MHIHAAGHQASSTCRHTTVAPMHGGSNLVCRAPATALKPVQLLSGPRFHAHKQAGTLQALPSGNTASAIVGKGPRPAIRKRAVAAAALAANNGASGGGEGEEVVGPRKSTRLCQHPACVTRASYGYPGGPHKCCKVHALPGMVDVRSKLCEHPGCKTRASFSQQGQPAKYCMAHAQEGMFNINNKRRSPCCDPAWLVGTHYEILGVSKEADQATIKGAFRKLVRKKHPDVNKEVRWLAVVYARCPGNKEGSEVGNKEGSEGG